MKNVPNKGSVSFCFCRELDVVSKIQQRFDGHPAWPGDSFHERSGKEWVKHMRIRNIQQKLLAKFGNAPMDGFNALDRDGGG